LNITGVTVFDSGETGLSIISRVGVTCSDTGSLRVTRVGFTGSDSGGTGCSISTRVGVTGSGTHVLY
jgi:hypothetical protein